MLLIRSPIVVRVTSGEDRHKASPQEIWFPFHVWGSVACTVIVSACSRSIRLLPRSSHAITPPPSSFPLFCFFYLSFSISLLCSFISPLRSQPPCIWHSGSATVNSRAGVVFAATAGTARPHCGYLEGAGRQMWEDSAVNRRVSASGDGAGPRLFYAVKLRFSEHRGHMQQGGGSCVHFPLGQYR